MFGALDRKNKPENGKMEDPAFIAAVAAVLEGNPSIQNSLEEKVDAILSSAAIVEKLFGEIESAITLNGRTFIKEQTDAVLNSPEFLGGIAERVSVLLKAAIENGGNKALADYLSEDATVALFRAQLEDKLKRLFKDEKIEQALHQQTLDLAGAKAEELVWNSLRQNIEREEIREELQAIAQEIIDAEIKESFPRIIRIEFQDGRRSRGTKQHQQFERVLTAAQIRGANLLLVGPAGSGKTRIAMEAARFLERDFYFNGPIQSEYKLLGFRDASGGYNPTPFYNAYTKGGVFLFDEIDASSAQALVAFNTAIANGYCDFPSTDQPVPVHPDFICMAAANTYGRGANHVYVGRSQLDAATLDRFIVIPVDYDEEMERNLAQNDDWVSKIQRWRKRAEELKIRHVISMRASMMGANLLKLDVPEAEVEEMVVWRGLDPSTVSKIKAM
ncbi:AAA family ATPase [Shinella sp. DD12]|uniref:AAA family ATPase n=2 Tax=Rhizobiaceae TaxID=82115 RepID=UPI0009DEABF2|nr:AAA family ATPase [Shinella sp. DD12]MCA0344843.1 AAA family ATPase [Pseudomonadota bacterium]